MQQQELRAAPRLTQAMENYLLSIYVVQERGTRVTNSNLVEQLRRVPGVSSPAVRAPRPADGLGRYTTAQGAGALADAKVPTSQGTSSPSQPAAS